MFFDGKLRSETDFQTLMDPYCKLLFQVIFTKEGRAQQA